MKARQSIGHDPAAVAQVPPNRCGKLHTAKAFDHGELHPSWMAPVVGLDGGDEGGFSGCLAGSGCGL